MKGLLVCALLTLGSLSANDVLLQRHESIFALLPNWNGETASLQPWGRGCTNQNYLLQVDGDRYFVRVGSAVKTALGLSIANEIELISLAASLNLSPPILAANAAHEIIICPFIESKPANLRNRQQLGEAIELLKKFHTSGAKLSTVVTPEILIASYLKQIDKLGIPLSSHQQSLIAQRPQPIITELCPCYLDLKSDNLLDDGSRLWLIDWEYGGMSDPLFDLATLAPAEGFSDDELYQALALYTPNPSEALKQRLREFRILANLRIALWSLIMSQTSTLDHPYAQWADELFRDVEAQLKMQNLTR